MYLLDVFAELKKTSPDSVLMLIGDGELKSDIIARIKELRIENSVILTGVRSDVNRLLQGLDCFVFPSFFEGLPLTVVEAQASGLPCYISNEVSTEVVISNLVNQYSIQESPQKWAETIAENGINDNRSDMSSVIKNAGYDISETVSQIESLYLSHA